MADRLDSISEKAHCSRTSQGSQAVQGWFGHTRHQALALCCSLSLCQSSTVAVGSSSLSPQRGFLQAGIAQPIAPESCWELSHSAVNGINLDKLGKHRAGDICSVISPLSLISIPACPQRFRSHWRPSSRTSKRPLPSPINRHCCQNILSQGRAILPQPVSAQP